VTRQRGVAQVVLLGLMTVTFVGLLGTSVLVKKNQDIRNRAMDVECQSSSECPDGLVCKDFFCVKPGWIKVCSNGDVQRCSIGGRAGQKECLNGRWGRCVETSSDAQEKCGMTAAELRKSEANCRNSGMRWNQARCECEKVALPAGLALPTQFRTKCTSDVDCNLRDQKCIGGYCVYSQLNRTSAGGGSLSLTPTSAVGSKCFGDMVLGKYVDTCPDGYICIDSSCREPPDDYDNGSWWTYDVCLDRGCRWDHERDKCDCKGG